MASTRWPRWRRTGPGVLVAVQDAGIGAHDLEMLFQPFFTTKRDGLGMGLSIARSIAEAHGGRLWARRNADHGLTFYLLLPGASAPQVAEDGELRLERLASRP